MLLLLKVDRYFWTALQARSQVLRFGGAKYILWGHDFCFYYIFKTYFSGNKSIWEGRKEIWGALPSNAPRDYGPAAL